LAKKATKHKKTSNTLRGLKSPLFFVNEQKRGLTLVATPPVVKKAAIYQRVLIKLSGEFMAGEDGFGIAPNQAASIAERIKSVCDMGVEVAIVIGAGNIWRGQAGVERGMDQSTADHMGMIATVMNGLALQDALERLGIETRVQTAVEMNKVAEPYIRLRAIHHMEKGRVVILTGGTGNPYFTTDTAGVLRCMEVNAEILIKATKVDGIYTADPKTNPDAERFLRLTFIEALQRQLRVMDSTALSLAMDNAVPVIVLNFWQEGALEKAMTGEEIGTYIGNDEMIEHA
jgi:uridylate kinase